MSITRRHTAIVMPTAEADKAITAGAKADPDAQPLTRTQLRSMVPLRALRGRPRSDRKKSLVSVRYSPEVLDYFRSTGAGWQSRMDGVLRRYVARQSRTA
jgi:uncharacterized protein (DUF4415 family)